MDLTLTEYIQNEAQLDQEARELYPNKFDKCTYDLGYIKQHLYSCLTCFKGAPMAVCYGCSITCHADHLLVDLWTKRDFRCDCGIRPLNQDITEGNPSIKSIHGIDKEGIKANEVSKERINEDEYEKEGIKEEAIYKECFHEDKVNNRVESCLQENVKLDATTSEENASLELFPTSDLQITLPEVDEFFCRDERGDDNSGDKSDGKTDEKGDERGNDIEDDKGNNRNDPILPNEEEVEEIVFRNSLEKTPKKTNSKSKIIDNFSVPDEELSPDEIIEEHVFEQLETVETETPEQIQARLEKEERKLQNKKKREEAKRLADIKAEEERKQNEEKERYEAVLLGRPFANCQLRPGKERNNNRVKAKHNFTGRYCFCNEKVDEDNTPIMFQCLFCEDWFHESCLGEMPDHESFNEMVCQDCCPSFLKKYENGRRIFRYLPSPGFRFSHEIKESEESFALYLDEGWLDELCRCDACTRLYEPFPFLMAYEDVYMPALDEATEESSYDKALKETEKLDRRLVLKSTKALEKLKKHLVDFLKPFAETNTVVSREDIQDFFNAKRSRLE